MVISELVAALYSQKPQGTLYHYTSLSGLLKIAQQRAIIATEIRYFNDSAELMHAAELIDIVVPHEYNMLRLPTDPQTLKLFRQFRHWVRDRLKNGHLQFVACFTARGNLLSQWRGYCTPGKGVSLGFAPDALIYATENQQPPFRMGKCVYDRDKKLDIVTSIIYAIAELAQTNGENPDQSNRETSFYHVFEEIEGDLLRIAALLKDPSFSEEEEWRAVSPVFTSYLDAPVEYREGASTLVPFIPFQLPTVPPGGLALNEVVVGPTPQMENSVDAISKFLSMSGASPRFGVLKCDIPYRAW